MTAPHDLVVALGRVEYVIDTPLAPLHHLDRESLVLVREALASLIRRCDAPDEDRAAIEALRHVAAKEKAA